MEKSNDKKSACCIRLYVYGEYFGGESGLKEKEGLGGWQVGSRKKSKKPHT